MCNQIGASGTHAAHAPRGVHKCRAKPFSGTDEADLKRRSAVMPAIKQWGAIMWAFIISLIYDQSCENFLAAMARHQIDGSEAPPRMQLT